MYDKEISESKKYLSAVVVAMNKLLALASQGKNKKSMQRQQKIFEQLRYKSGEEKFYKFWQSYSKKTTKNLSKLKNRYEHVDVSKVEDALRKDSRDFELKQISKIVGILSHTHDLKDSITALSREYNETLKEIENYKRRNRLEQEREQQRQRELEERRREYSKPKLTEEQIRQQRRDEERERDQRRIDENSSVLLEGPKKRGLISAIQGKDEMLKDMEYLYGLAMDILIIMESDQHVDINNTQHGNDARIWNAYFESIYDKKEKTQMILNSYGVNNVDSLLNKYEKTRNLYYKKFLKLSNEKKEKYDISKFDTYDISSSLERGSVSITLLSVLKNENLKFPPSKEKLIQMINSRIMNGRYYKLASPDAREETITGRPNSYKEYDEVKKYYRNLTKNMSIEEVVSLYKRVAYDINERFQYLTSGEINYKGYYAVTQRLFCEIIFDKKEMKFTDTKQEDKALAEIADKYLKEETKYSIYGHDKVTEEEQQKRQMTIEKEYVRYLANLKNKKDKISFRDFAKQKYDITNVVEPQNIEERVKEEIRGMKK